MIGGSGSSGEGWGNSATYCNCTDKMYTHPQTTTHFCCCCNGQDSYPSQVSPGAIQPEIFSRFHDSHINLDMFKLRLLLRLGLNPMTRRRGPSWWQGVGSRRHNNVFKRLFSDKVCSWYGTLVPPQSWTFIYFTCRLI